MHVALQHAASFHCLMEEWEVCVELKPKPKEKWSFIDKRSEGMKHRTEWCEEADRYRCMRDGRGSKHMKMPGRCTGPKFLSQSSFKWRRRHLGGHDLVRRMDRQGESLDMVQKVFRIREAKNGTKAGNLLQTRTDGHQRIWQNEEKNPTLEEGRVPAKEAKNWRIEGEKKRIARKEYQRLLNNFEMEGLMSQKGLWKVTW